MKLAVIGTGFGAYHTELYHGMEDVEQIVVWGRNHEKLKELQEKFSVTVTQDMEEIFQNPEIDLVDVCVPNHMHREVAVKALQSGKHVFIEIPVAETMEDALAIKEAANIAGKHVYVDLFLKFQFPYVYLQQLVSNQQYGALKELQIWRQTPPWWGNLDTKKIALNLMVHDIDYVTWLMGVPDQVSAAGFNVCENQSIVTSVCEYKGAQAIIRAASNLPAAYPFVVGYEANFEKAMVRFHSDDYGEKGEEIKLELFSDTGREEPVLCPANCYKKALEEVVHSVKEDRTSCLDLREAINSLQVIMDINKSLDVRNKQ